jgi:uncharacterized Zn finger protein
MPCPSCSHTMQLLFMDSTRTIHLCPRCGTIKDIMLGHEDVIVPKLVSRCREFEVEMAKENIGQYYRNTWRRLGIHESIHPPV